MNALIALTFCAFFVSACSDSKSNISGVDTPTPHTAGETLSGNNRAHSSAKNSGGTHRTTENFSGLLEITKPQSYRSYLKVLGYCPKQYYFGEDKCKQIKMPLYIELQKLRFASNKTLIKSDVIIMPYDDKKSWGLQNGVQRPSSAKVFYKIKNKAFWISRLRIDDSPERVLMSQFSKNSIHIDLVYRGEVIASGDIHR